MRMTSHFAVDDSRAYWCWSKARGEPEPNLVVASGERYDELTADRTRHFGGRHGGWNSRDRPSGTGEVIVQETVIEQPLGGRVQESD